MISAFGVEHGISKSYIKGVGYLKASQMDPVHRQMLHGDLRETQLLRSMRGPGQSSRSALANRRGEPKAGKYKKLRGQRHFETEAEQRLPLFSPHQGVRQSAVTLTSPGRGKDWRPFG